MSSPENSPTPPSSSSPASPSNLTSPSLSTSAPPIIKPSMRPFKRRKSSNSPAPPHTHNSHKTSNLNQNHNTLHQKISSLEQQLSTLTSALNLAISRAHAAEQREARLRELAQMFWREEFGGMMQVMELVCEDEYVREVEERVLEEYGGLFGAGGMEREGDDERDGERVVIA